MSIYIKFGLNFWSYKIRMKILPNRWHALVLAINAWDGEGEVISNEAQLHLIPYQKRRIIKFSVLISISFGDEIYNLIINFLLITTTNLNL